MNNTPNARIGWSHYDVTYSCSDCTDSMRFSSSSSIRTLSSISKSSVDEDDEDDNSAAQFRHGRGCPYRRSESIISDVHLCGGIFSCRDCDNCGGNVVT